MKTKENNKEEETFRIQRNKWDSKPHQHSGIIHCQVKISTRSKRFPIDWRKKIHILLINEFYRWIALNHDVHSNPNKYYIQQVLYGYITYYRIVVVSKE